MQTAKEQAAGRFIRLLSTLTDEGKVEWAQEEKPGHIHCMVGEEYITFEVLAADTGHVRPDHEEIAYIASYCRNVTYLWVPIFPNWEVLINLLRQAPIDDERIVRFKNVTLDIPARVLEGLTAV